LGTCTALPGHTHTAEGSSQSADQARCCPGRKERQPTGAEEGASREVDVLRRADVLYRLASAQLTPALAEPKPGFLLCRLVVAAGGGEL